jgi:hypothetical protein
MSMFPDKHKTTTKMKKQSNQTNQKHPKIPQEEKLPMQKKQKATYAPYGVRHTDSVRRASPAQV